ncbi:Uncharacterized protein DAT39_007780 [Clarias magur]|uniref:Uncharacterized protein n=1 Tax=Clarias magur TaxID=1594786 RepID=A0A8J4U2A0_CLAMG|nr:Uncharacterized protein DAT39_007780 [Clarias magur]
MAVTKMKWLFEKIRWHVARVHVISEGTACLSIAPAGERESAHHQVTDFTMAQ